MRRHLYKEKSLRAAPSSCVLIFYFVWIILTLGKYSTYCGYILPYVNVFCLELLCSTLCRYILPYENIYISPCRDIFCLIWICSTLCGHFQLWIFLCRYICSCLMRMYSDLCECFLTFVDIFYLYGSINPPARIFCFICFIYWNLWL